MTPGGAPRHSTGDLSYQNCPHDGLPGQKNPSVSGEWGGAPDLNRKRWITGCRGEQWGEEGVTERRRKLDGQETENGRKKDKKDKRDIETWGQ